MSHEQLVEISSKNNTRPRQVVHFERGEQGTHLRAAIRRLPRHQLRVAPKAIPCP
jgi:hypothetical protein